MQYIISMLLTPTKYIPKECAHIFQQKEAVSSQYIVGYRTIIFQDNTLGIIKNPKNSSCTRAFCFKLNQQQSNQIRSVKMQQGTIQEVSGNFIVLCPIQKRLKPGKMQQPQIISILQSIDLKESSQMNPICYNLLTNCFDNYQDFAESVGWYLKGKKKEAKPLTVEEKIKQQYYLKNLNGEKLYQLPKYSKQTGNWDDSTFISLKIQE